MPLAIQLGSQPVSVQTGYCTNVHAGRNLETVYAHLKEHSLPVRNALVEHRNRNAIPAGPSDAIGTLAPQDATLGLGLWFSEVSVREALEPANLLELKKFLSENRLRPYTFNGFPQTDFHESVVKHRVYSPTWCHPSRLEYTELLVQLLDELLPTGETGSISTLPIGWGEPGLTKDQIDQVAFHWNRLAQYLHQLYERTGRTILVAVEPEPGCIFTDSAGYRRFYVEEFLPRLATEKERDIAKRYITLCHDVCHAAVMYEDQASELVRFFDHGIRVGKVQVSSAVDVDWSGLHPDQREKAWEQLKAFDEVRYLHQVHIQPAGSDADASRQMIEDLPEAIQKHPDAPKSGRWRVHFHVPIYQPQLDGLSTTQSEIRKCLDLLLPKVGTEAFPTGHFEVETYAWTVLPKHLQVPVLSDGIAMELQWFESLLHSYSAPDASIGLPC